MIFLGVETLRFPSSSECRPRCYRKDAEMQADVLIGEQWKLGNTNIEFNRIL